MKDPDWYYKMKKYRYNFKSLFFLIGFNAFIFYLCTLRVKRYDANFRQRQREALNTELKGVIGKKIHFQLFDKADKPFNSYDKNYVVLWYDAKMVNYLNLIKDLKNKKLATDRVLPILVVDNPEHISKVYMIKEKATTFKLDRVPLLSQQNSQLDQQNVEILKTQFSKGFELT